MRILSDCKIAGLVVLAVGLASLVACGDDDSFSPVSKNRGYDYAYTSAKDLSKTPCDEMREGREAVIGRDKNRYECRYDYKDSVYIWVGDEDTLTAEGREFHRAESSSSKDDDDSSSSRSSSNRNSSSSYSSSYSSSSSRYSSSSYSSSSSWPMTFSSIEVNISVDSKEDFFNPDVEYGTLIDERDGKTYKTVTIGERVWMAENLNFADKDAYPILDGHSICFNDLESNCDLLGRLYDRAAAMNSASCDYEQNCDLGNTVVRGLCPDGWHIPTKQEAGDLLAFVDDDFEAAASATGWPAEYAGNNASGLSLVGAGNLSSHNFYHVGRYNMIWFYTADVSQWYMVFGKGNNHLQEYTSEKEFVSIRCVKGDGAVLSSSSVESSSSSMSTTYTTMTVPFTVESKEEFFNPDVDYGTLVDDRDGKTYKTVTIGKKVWMAENLNFADADAYPILEGHSICFNNMESNCDLLGRLYDRAAAMNSASCDSAQSCNLGTTVVRGLCPAGWHIPTKGEAEDLLSFANDDFSAVISTKGWKSGVAGTNTSGFSQVGSGNLSGNRFYHAGELAMLWFHTVSTSQWYLILENGKSKLQEYRYEPPHEREFVSIRCVMD